MKTVLMLFGARVRCVFNEHARNYETGIPASNRGSCREPRDFIQLRRQ